MNVNKLADSIRHGVISRGDGTWDFRFEGKPEGSPAVTRYPNLVAEIAAGRSPLERYADAANVSYPVFAAVIEDGERLTPEEMRGFMGRFALPESGGGHRLTLDYLLSPALSVIDPQSRKGKILRWQFEQADAAATRDAYRFYGEKIRCARRIYRRLCGDSQFCYAEFRQAMNAMEQAIHHAEIRIKRGERRTVRFDVGAKSPEQQFLDMVHDPNRREALLKRLAQSGLLSSFLQAENGTVPHEQASRPEMSLAVING